MTKKKINSLTQSEPNISKSSLILIVDLDGTLIRTDMLHETFWSAFSYDWKVPFKAFYAVFSGKANLKDYLWSVADVDVKTLPYNDIVISYIKEFRANGGRTGLVTASNHKIAKQIAKYLAIFDEFHGSDSSVNLKGRIKADFLTSHFGEKSFLYLGDSQADLQVWKQAKTAITLDIKPNLKKAVERINPNYEHLDSYEKSPASYLKAMRPHQWLKNSLLFLPMLASHQFEAKVLANSLIAFLAFSLIASSVYVTNDLLDLNSDRLHPRKKKRPFASGTIPINHGGLLALSLFLVGVTTALLLNTLFLFALLFYYALTSAYSLSLKRRAVIDICTLSGLYTMRIIGGGLATDIKLSFWLLVFSIFIFLSLAAIKRQAELIDARGRGVLQISGRGYHLDDLPLISMLAISSGLISVLVMALYVNSPSVIALYPTPFALGGVCCILLYWLIRMALITHRGGMHDDPIIFAVKDKNSLLCFVMICVLIIFGSLP